MKGRNKNGLLVLLGVAAGAAAGFYLNSDKGRKMRKETGEQLNRWGEDIGDRARSGVDQLSSTMNSAVDRSKEYVTEMGGALRSRLDRISRQVDNLKSGNGMEKAKQRIKKRLRQLEEALETEIS